MKKLGIYVRVSTKTQENKGTSLEYQLKVGKELCKRMGMKPVIYNEGGKTSWSSNINTRPELVRMLNDIKTKKMDSVWCWKMDRLGRNSESWFSIFKILIQYKINLYEGESDKPYDYNNPTDRLVTNILSSISTYDNEIRRIRMIYGKKESLKRGQTFIGGDVTFGYYVDENKMLQPDPLKKPYVKKMFQMIDKGKSTTDIQVMMNQSEVPPPRSGKGWNLGTIQKILRNTIYIGTQEWIWKEKEPDGTYTIVENIKIKTPKLVPKNLFDRVQKIQDKYKRVIINIILI